jgi:hypothetical protein
VYPHICICMEQEITTKQVSTSSLCVRLCVYIYDAAGEHLILFMRVSKSVSVCDCACLWAYASAYIDLILI